MKKHFLMVCLTACYLLPQGLSAQVLCQRQLVWHDEFNTAGNFSQWKVYEGDGCNETSGCGFGNSELQLYRAANAVVGDTTLTITSKFETVVNPVDNKTFKYTSAKLMSKVTGTDSLQSFLYGRIEARIKLPSASNVWPGFWLLSPAGGWPNTGEIDIMEAQQKNPVSVNGTIHYAYPAGVHQSSGTKYTGTVDLSADYHVYAVEWSPYRIDWFVDSTLYFSQTPSTTVGGAWPFDINQMYIILNVAVGGPNTPFTGKTTPVSTDYPTSMKVDYVRVYKGIYNYAVFGKNLVYPNEAFQDYRIDTISGAAYSWTVPTGATILSGQGTNLITVNWGNTGGDVTVNVTTPGCATKTFSRTVQLKPALVADKLYEDFETNRLITYGPMTGTLQQAVSNPGAGRVNTSSLVGQYTRNAGSQYDDIYLTGIPVPDAMDYVQSKKKLFIDVYTTAPIGSEIDMQLENTSLSFVNPFPSGRHSKYVAFTTRQNSWETLEFNYNQTISNSGVDIFSIDKMVLLMEPGKFTANTWWFDNVRVMQQPSAKWTVIAAGTLENYDGASHITFNDTITSGGYTAHVANPAPGGTNNSANVAKYVRNDTTAYDVLFFNSLSTIPNAAPFKSQDYQLQMDVYSTAPVGTGVSINLQNNVLGKLAYPSGRNSSYQAVTTKQNQWETLTFYYSSAPNGASDFAIDQLAVLFSPNKPGAQTWYIDNIRIGKKVVYGSSSMYENYDSVNLFTYQQSDGVYVPNATNPAPNSVNSSVKTAKYTRNTGAQYDVITISTNAIKDGESFKEGARQFAMDVYTSAPVGTLLSWQLENSTRSTPGNYPTGRHSNYQGAVTQTNAWHTVYFYLQSVPDPGTYDAQVDRASLLFAANSFTGDVYYIDNLRALNGVTSDSSLPAGGLPSPWQNQDIGAVAAAGSASYSSNVFTVKASGADIWNTADEFQYVYQPFNGDGQIIARVDTLGNTNASAKACVMIRESLDANAVEVNTLVKAGGGTAISYRSATGGSTTSVNTSGTPPKWLKLVRAGNVFTSYRSDDGSTWTSISSKTVTMGTQAFVGMGVTSHNDGVLTTARFSNVSVTHSGAGQALVTGVREGVGAVAPTVNTPSLKLYPNPANGVVNIQWEGRARRLVIYDVTGRSVLSMAIREQVQSTLISLAGWQKGVYFVNVELEDGNRTVRFVKE